MLMTYQGIIRAACRFAAITIAVLLITVVSISGTGIGFAMGLCFAGVAIFSIWPDRNRQTDYLNPLRVFVALWSSSVALAVLQLNTLMTEWGPKMWFSVSAALVFFSLGFAATAAPVLLAGSRDSVLLNLKPVPGGRCLAFGVFFVLIGVSATAYEFYLIGGIPILMPHYDVVRAQLFGLGGHGKNLEYDTITVKLVNECTTFLRYGSLLAAIALAQRTLGTVTRKSAAIAAIGVALLASSAQGGRGQIVQVVLTVVVPFHYLRKPLTFKSLGLGALGVFLFLSLALFWRVQLGGQSASDPFAHQISKMPPGPAWDRLAYGYYSTTVSMEVFNRILTDLPETNLQGFLLYSLHRFVPRADIQKFTNETYGGAMITPTFLGEFYGDLGIAGVCAGPLMIGLAYGWLYCRLRRGRSIVWLVVYSLLCFDLAMLPYQNEFSYHIEWLVDISVGIAAVRAAAGKGQRRADTVRASRVFNSSGLLSTE